MKLMLDTNTCIYIIKHKPPQVLDRFNSYIAGDIAISSITVAELQYGVQKSQQPQRNQEALEKFLLPLMVVDFDRPASVAYGQIRTVLERAGRPIGPLDTLIAAHALSLRLTLVTNNVDEFVRVPGLKVVNWASI